MSRRKKLFYGTVGFLACFSIDPRKPHSKIPKTRLYNILKLAFLEIFKNGCFCFSQFSRNFVFLKISILCTVGILTCFSINLKNRPQKYPKLISLQHFEVDIPENFQK